MTKLTPARVRRMFKGKAKFRVAPGSDNPYNTAVPRVIVSNIKDNKTYETLKRMESKLEEAFDVEIVVYD
jgi:hypothetical protein